MIVFEFVKIAESLIAQRRALLSSTTCGQIPRTFRIIVMQKHNFTIISLFALLRRGHHGCSCLHGVRSLISVNARLHFLRPTQS